MRKGKRERSCRQCFAYISYDARKCRYCGFKYKSSGKYLFDKIKQVLNIDRVYSLNKVEKHSRRPNLFAPQEIENMLKPDNFRILMFLVLDDIAFLDETALIELGETLMKINVNELRRVE
ncbi:MAG: hypothetical protein LH614_20900 [Pyrinomonadaceae bacterium]|nr:hypothetical protein [Pyrinomonadaceae bacterium]